MIELISLWIKFCLLILLYIIVHPFLSLGILVVAIFLSALWEFYIEERKAKRRSAWENSEEGIAASLRVAEFFARHRK